MIIQKRKILIWVSLLFSSERMDWGEARDYNSLSSHRHTMKIIVNNIIVFHNRYCCSSMAECSIFQVFPHTIRYERLQWIIAVIWIENHLPKDSSLFARRDLKFAVCVVFWCDAINTRIQTHFGGCGYVGWCIFGSHYSLCESNEWMSSAHGDGYVDA